MHTEPSNAPQNVTVGVLNATSVQILWQPPPPEQRNGIIAGYAVRMVGLHSGENIEFPLTNSTEMAIEGLHPFYAYRFSVAAFTVGLGPFSNAVTQKLPESSQLSIIYYSTIQSPECHLTVTITHVEIACIS